MRKIGTPCKLFVDFDQPSDKDFQPLIGDVLLSNGGSGYLVLQARKVNSRTRFNRWKFDCLRIHPQQDPVISAATRFIDFTWYKR